MSNHPQLPEPPPEAQAVSDRLRGLIVAEIERDGAISFERYMELALYKPGLGYYSAGAEKFGAAGDFVTAPELGNVFARCLATPVSDTLSRLDEGGQILELGAGSGQLACDLMLALDEKDALPQRYRILELSADLRQRQRHAVAKQVPQFLDRFEWLDEAPDSPYEGVILGNEVVDALPARRFVKRRPDWCELRVGLDQGRLAFGPLSSFLLHRLLNEPVPVADPANASRTLVWDCRQRDWSVELLDLFGLPVSALPKSVPSRYGYGALRVGPHNVPLELATGDQSAALFGFGEPTPVTVYVNLGTGAFLQQAVGPEPIALPGLLSSVVYQDQAHSLYVLEGTVNGAGSAILKIADELGMDREYLQANSAKWLDEVTDPPLFLNGVGGLGSPYWVADFPTRFVGDAASDGPARIVAVIESIAFLLAVNLEAFTLHDPAPERLVVTGGLAAIDPLCRRLADLAGMRVIRPQVQEATAQGLAYLLADHPPHWLPAGSEDVFRSRAGGPIHERYRRWRNAMQDAMDALT